MGAERYWYVAAESAEVSLRSVVAARILDHALVLFRDRQGDAVALRDRCLHRCGKLSSGRMIEAGRLACPYHGWVYDGSGRIVSIPAEGGADAAAARNLRVPSLRTCERDGYIYVCLKPDALTGEPFAYPWRSDRRFASVRLKNVFLNDVTNCVENFVDVPHTASVHPGIFRRAKGELIHADVTVKDGSVSVDYKGERRNLGTFAWLLNSRGLDINHRDCFLAPNVTHVRYEVGAFSFYITSQSTPVSTAETLVYTELAYDFGWLTPVAGAVVRRQGQRVIDQDRRVLADQMEVLKDRPAAFTHTAPDIIHKFIHEIRDAVLAGRDPRAVPERRAHVSFLV